MNNIYKIAFTFLLASCAFKKPIEYHHNKTVINHHTGGVIAQEYQKIKQYKRPIKIKGFCASACTFVFKYPDTCVSTTAKILLHAPRYKGKIDKGFYLFNKRTYPQAISRWYDATLDGRDYIFTGQEMIEKFNIRKCVV